jgi:hypothetical protein
MNLYLDPNKVIITDVDGVLLDWGYHFNRWMIAKGFSFKGDRNSYNVDEIFGLDKKETRNIIKHFNESAEIAFLSPLRDAVKYVRKLHEEHGYVFHCITSMTTNRAAQELRKRNLETVFGPGLFEECIFLATGADKDEALKPYIGSGCYWIEDKPQNADLGVSYGLNTLLVAHPYNIDYSGKARKVQNWKEIYNIITGE